jgi:hypothetical protein
MTFRENLSGANTIKRDFSVDSVVNYFLAGIERYIRWSLIMKATNGRIYKEYLGDYYMKPAFGKDEPVLLRDLLGKLFQGTHPDSLYGSLSIVLKKAYEKKTEALFHQGQFTEAVKMLENESHFCLRNPWLAGQIPDPKLQAKVLEGIYSSFLGVA